jgi:hypothetical protein
MASTKPSGVNKPRPSSVKSAECLFGMEIDLVPVLDPESIATKSKRGLPAEEGPRDLTSPNLRRSRRGLDAISAQSVK